MKFKVGDIIKLAASSWQQFHPNVKAAYHKKAMILTEQKRQEQQQELQKLALELQNKMRAVQMDFQKKQIAKTKPIIDKLQEQVNLLAKEKNYDMVINPAANNVIWAKDKFDITVTVVKRFEKLKKS